MSPFDDLERLDVTEHSELVRDLARRHARDASSADDLAQDTWLVALERPPQDQRRLRAWFARVVRNLAIDRAREEHRRRRREELAFRLRDGPERDAASKLDPDRIASVLARLDQPYRVVIELHYLQQRTVPSIARELGLPAETVRTRLRRGLLRLRASARHEERRGRRLSGLLAAALRWLRKEPPRVPQVFWGSALVLAGVVVTTFAVLSTRSAREATVRGGPAIALAQDGAARLSGAEDFGRDGAPLRTALETPTGIASLAVVARVASGAPAAVLELELVSDAHSHGLRLDSAGRGSLSALEPGTYSVAAARGERTSTRLSEGANELQLTVPDLVRVEGSVTGPEGSPVSAEIWVTWPKRPERGVRVAPTDSLGRYAVEVDPAAWIGARAEGLAASERVAVGSLLADSVGMRVADLVLETRTRPLAGSVRTEQGERVPGALLTHLARPTRVRLAGPGGARATCEQQSWMSDESGAFRLELPENEVARVLVSAEGFAPRYVEWDARSGSDVLEIVLARGTTLRGVVRFPDARPAPGAQVELVPSAPLATLVAKADARGHFALAHLPSGGAVLRAAAVLEGRAFAAELELDPAAGVRQELTLMPRPAITGVVVDEDGRELAGWEVVLSCYGEGIADPRAQWIDAADEIRQRADERGRFAIVPPANRAVLSLGAYAPGDAGRPRALLTGDFGVDQECRIVVSRVRAFRVHGRVHDPSGSPASDACVLLGDTRLPRPYVLSVDPRTGEFASEDLLPGPFVWAALQFGQRCTSGVGPRTLGFEGDEDLGVLVLEPLGELEVELTGSDPSLIADAAVELQGGHLRLTSPARYARDGVRILSPGRVLFPGLARFSYALRVSGPNLATSEQQVQVLPGQTTRVEVSCVPGVPNHIRVVGRRDRRPHKVFLTVRRECGEELHRWPVLRTPDESDDIRIGLSPGRYLAEVSSEGRSKAVAFDVPSPAGRPIVLDADELRE